MAIILSNFEHEKAEICFLGSISNVMNYLEYNTSEALLFGMGSGLRFCFYPDGDPNNFLIEDGNFRIPHFKCIEMSADREYVADIYNRIGVHLSIEYFTTIDEQKERIIKELQAGRPAILVVNMRFLDYYPERLKIDGGHIIICYGIDEESDKAFVSDNFMTTIPRSNYIGEVSLSRLLLALNLKSVFGNHPYQCLFITPLSKNPPITEEEILDAITRSGKTMLEKSSEAYCKNGNNGIMALAQSIIREKSNLSLEEYEYWISRTHFMFTLGGPISTRKLYGDFLCWAISERGINCDPHAIDICKQLSKEWQGIANLISKASITQRYELLERASSKVLCMIEQEECLADILVNIKRRR